MSNDLFDYSQQPLLPQTVNDLLIYWSVRLGGFLLMAVTAVLWLSLLTWSAADPSLSTTSSAGPTNLLGSGGAIVSDLLLQMFGLGAVVALSCLMVWSFRLLVCEYIDRVRMRCAMALFSLFALAGSLSSLPVSNSWAFLHGYGGILGDLSYDLLAGLLISLFGQSGNLLAGLVMLAAGCASFICAMGLPPSVLFFGLANTLRHDFQSEGDDSAQTSQVFSTSPAEAVIPKFDLSNLNPAQARLADFGQVGNPDNVHDQRLQVRANRPEDESGMLDLKDHSPEDDVVKNVGQLQASNDVNSHSPDTLEPYENSRDLCARKMAMRFAPHSSVVATGPSKGHSIPPHVSASFQHHEDNRTGQQLPRFEQQPDSKKPSAPQIQTDQYRSQHARYRRPSLDELQTHDRLSDSTGRGIPKERAVELNQTAEKLTRVLKDFRVKGDMRDVRPGPIVTLFEFEPAPGTKASRIISLADDIARSMSAESARIAVIPGRNAIGIELPNAERERVLLRDVLESDAYRNCDARLPLALGKGIDGKPVIADLTRMPHLLAAGTTGSGKSVGINAMILSLLYQKTPGDCRLLMIDPKMLELSAYNGIPHLLAPVITEPHHAALALEWAVRQMENRYKQMTEMGARSIEVFNNRARHAQQSGAPPVQRVHVGFDPDNGTAQFQDKPLNFEPMPYIVIIVDEFADLMAVAGKEIDVSLKRLSQMARAAGIHLIMATQRPSVDVVTGTIKANFPTRIAYRVASKIDSRTIVNCAGAEQLLGQGDLLLANGGSAMLRAHGPFVSDDEVEAVANALKMQAKPNYAADLMTLLETSRTVGSSEPTNHDGKNQPRTKRRPAAKVDRASNGKIVA